MILFLLNGLGRKIPGPGRGRSRARQEEGWREKITRFKTRHLDRLPGKPSLLTVHMDSSVRLQEEVNAPSITSTPLTLHQCHMDVFCRSLDFPWAVEKRTVLYKKGRVVNRICRLLQWLFWKWSTLLGHWKYYNSQQEVSISSPISLPGKDGGSCSEAYWIKSRRLNVIR